MVKVRLRRMGAINKPFYRIVAVDSRKKRDGKYLDNLGYYDPKTEPLTLQIETDKAIKWLKVGAQISETVQSLFRRAGIMEKWHQMKLGKNTEKVDEIETEEQSA